MSYLLYELQNAIFPGFPGGFFNWYFLHFVFKSLAKSPVQPSKGAKLDTITRENNFCNFMNKVQKEYFLWTKSGPWWTCRVKNNNSLPAETTKLCFVWTYISLAGILWGELGGVDQTPISNTIPPSTCFWP